MLDKEHKAELQRAILKIASILKNLDSVPADPRAFDMLEIAASLFEQQLEQNISYEIGEEDFISEVIDSNCQTGAEDYSEDTIDYDTTGFKFLSSDEDIPTAEELRDQYETPWPFTP